MLLLFAFTSPDNVIPDGGDVLPEFLCQFLVCYLVCWLIADQNNSFLILSEGESVTPSVPCLAKPRLALPSPATPGLATPCSKPCRA
jgi:hypothetical protein